MSVFVLDRRKKPLMPCSEKRARLLLEQKRAVVARFVPFTIRLKDRVGGALQPVSIKLDPGSKVTGVAVTRESHEVTHALWLAALTHRGASIRKALAQRQGYRRRRRSANLRYRAPRLLNRTKQAKWLAPSLRHRLETTMAWVQRLRRLCPVSQLAMELVRFDLQKELQPEIAGVMYQQGELAGYEVREYLLEKWGRAGRGSYQRTRVTASGFKRGFLMRAKSAYGFRSGDLVRAVVPDGKKAGTHTGRVAIRASGSFNVQTHGGVLQGLSYRYCRTLQRGDGYGYARQTVLLHRLPSRGDGFRTGEVG